MANNKKKTKINYCYNLKKIFKFNQVYILKIFFI